MGLGIRPTALLVAGEERMFKHRHPLPTPAPLRRACMVVVCAQRHGLTANLTRTRSWDHPETSSLHDEVLEVESKALEATRPGHTLAGVIAAVRRAYSTLGRPDAFEQHHQGGIAGYRSREVLATPGSTVELKVGMAVAWNPSLPGAKAEDTFLLGKRGLENLTFDPDWPIERVHGRDRPALLLS